MTKPGLITTVFSFQHYYSTLNYYYNKVFKKFLMLHYPLFHKNDETLEKRLHNLTDYCISLVGDLKNKRVLEVGCGNGVQSIYIAENYNPAEIIGVDIIRENIEIALHQDIKSNRVIFYIDDAEKLENISDNSIDTLLCIESAFHYPNKEHFLKTVKRVLKPEGEFLIADILSKSYKKRFFIENWKKKMNYFHWTEGQYKNSFAATGIHVDKSVNITASIITGYKGYRKWVTKNECGSLLRYYLLQLFIFIFVNINIHSLNNRRIYMVFTGRKRCESAT